MKPRNGSKQQAGNAPLRVLHLAESPYMGGITSHILSVAQAFQGHPQIAIHVATLGGRRSDRTLLDQGKALGIPVKVFPMGATLDLRVLYRLRKYLRAEDIDLVHTHNYRATIVARLAGGCPVLPSVHTAMSASGARLGFWQRLERVFLRRLPMVIAVSGAVQRWLVHQGLREERIRVCHNACAVTPVSSAALDKLRMTHGIPPECVVVAYIGRLAEDKGLETLLEAACDLPVQLLLVGDGPLRATLEAQCDRLPVQAHFTGMVADPAAYYALADIVALPSRMEALPMSLIEAAARGKAAVATMVGGIPEVVQDGKTGLLVPYGDVPMLREALSQLLDTSQREAMGAAARRRWQAHFAPEEMAACLTACYFERLRNR